MEAFRPIEDFEDVAPEERIDMLMPSEEDLDEQPTEPYVGFGAGFF